MQALSILALVAAVATLGAAPAPATSPWAPTGPSPWSSPPPAGSVTVGGVVVTKKFPGPAMWRITKGDAQVIILGGLTPLPHMLVWDTARVEHALQGADALYLPPRPTIGAMGLFRLALDKGALQLPRGQTLETVLPPNEKKRFAALMVTIHAKASTYDRWKPAVAGLFLVQDFRKAAGLSDGKPGTTVMHMAEDEHVPVQYVGELRLDKYVDTAAHLTPQQNLACFDAALDDIDREAAHTPSVSKAWAVGDLKTVGENYKTSLLEGCLSRIPSIAGLLDRGAADGVTTIQTALLKPGKSVAVIDLNFLLRPNGVLDRLKAQGAQISVPD
jgi:uncharacterized protein YbaP (TraB family)